MQKPAAETTFARDLGLFDATMIGVGAMIGAGIFVLTGIAAGEAGPASLLSFALNGFVTLLTAFAYAELASAIPRAGGGYSFVRMAFPGGTGFVAGWMLWFAYTVACSLYALGFAGYFWEFLHKYLPSLSELVFEVIGRQQSIIAVTLLIGVAFIWLNARGTEVTGRAENALTVSKLVILVIFVTFGILVILEEPQEAMGRLTPFFPKELGGVIIAMGLTFIAFEGYDLIATVAEEIKDPEKNIPRATFISLAITVVLYLLILLVSLAAINVEGMTSWEFLGQYQETAIVKAAEDFMPTFGVALIVFGGLLSTMSALNATVMAASRVAFSMGRDLWLPKMVATLHPVKRTPQVAIVITGIILLIMALALPIGTVGSAASLMFLLTFAMVNLAVIALRRKYPEIPRKYKVPFYPAVPILGFVLNIFLALYQFKFQPMAWYVTCAWIALGLLLYFAIFEKRASSLEPQVLLPRPTDYETDEQPCVMVALHNPENVATLLEFASSVSRQRGIRTVAITVVEVPRQVPIHDGLRFAHHREPLLEQARRHAAKIGLKLETDLVIAHHTHDGILTAGERHSAEALIMGWKGFTNARDRIFGEIADSVIRLATSDLLLLKLEEKKRIKTCLLPTAGGPNAQLAASIIGSMARHKDMEVTVAYVVPEGATSDQRSSADERIEATISRLELGGKARKLLIESRSIPGGIAKASRDFDLVAIGAAKEPFFRKMLFGEIPEKVARYSPSAVLVVKRYEGLVKSLLKRVFG